MRVHLVIAVCLIAAAGCATGGNRGDMPESSGQVRGPVPAQAASPSEPNSADAAFDELEQELAQKQESVPDPLEPVNRFMFGVNDVLYFWVVQPIARAYAGVVPKPVRTGIRNFFHNVGTPARLVNCLLQGKGTAAGTEVQRFALNTTAGVLGFGDPALERWGLKPAEEDLGQTLAVYGLHEGFYFVWPFFGPSTARDSLGMLGDQFLNPVRYIDPQEVSIGISAVSATNAGSLRLGEYEAFKAAALDPYVAMREAYVQYRKQQIQDQPSDPNRGRP
jgi:phospholipid-binding lipoprotein MlaA